MPRARSDLEPGRHGMSTCTDRAARARARRKGSGGHGCRESAPGRRTVPVVAGSLLQDGPLCRKDAVAASDTPETKPRGLIHPTIHHIGGAAQNDRAPASCGPRVGACRRRTGRARAGNRSRPACRPARLHPVYLPARRMFCHNEPRQSGTTEQDRDRITALYRNRCRYEPRGRWRTASMTSV